MCFPIICIFRKRAANKRRKIKTLGKSRSTETDDEDDEGEEGNACHLTSN